MPLPLVLEERHRLIVAVRLQIVNMHTLELAFAHDLVRHKQQVG